MDEIAVVGSGVTGLAAACLLARAGHGVTVVDDRAPADAPPADAPQPRVLALSRASLGILEQCGARQHLVAERVQPWTAMRVWEDEGSEIHFRAEDVNEAYLGCIVEHQNLVYALARAARTRGVEFRQDALDSLEEGTASVSIQLRSGERMEAALVIGADGARSPVRESAGLSWQDVGTPEGAVVCEVATDEPFEPVAWQRFAPQGPAALLPLFNGHYSLIWSRADAQQARDMDLPSFEAELSEWFGSRMGGLQVCGQRVSFALARGRAPGWCTSRVVLAGDAAHVVHPLAGLGQNLGLMDAAVLEEEWSRHPGTLRALRAYERRRKGPSRATQAVLEGFRAGFGVRGKSCTALRSAALDCAGRYRGVRKFFLGLADPGVDVPDWLSARRARSERTSARR